LAALALAFAGLAVSCNFTPATGQAQKDEWRDPNADLDLTEPPPTEWNDHPERITEPGLVALVGNEKITTDEFYAELEKDYRTDGTDVLVDDTIIALESDRIGFKPSPEDIRAYAEKMETLRLESMTETLNREYQGRKTLEEYFKETRGISIEEFKAKNIKQALDSGAAEKQMRIETLIAYEIYTSARVRIRHIRVKTEEKAKDLIKRLDGGAEFKRLVDEESEDLESRADGGAIYPFHKGDEAFRKELQTLGTELLDKVFAAPLGLMPAPLKSADGFYHVVVVLETQQARNTKYADCKAEVQKVIEKGFNQGDGIYWRERKRHQYKVEVKSEGDICATVGDKQITAKELRAKLTSLFGQEMAQRLIAKRMMAAEAARIGMTNTDDEIRTMAGQITEDRLLRVKQMLAYQYPMRQDIDTMLADYIRKETGKSIEDHRKQAVDDLIKNGKAQENLTLAKLVVHYLLTTERVTVQEARFDDESRAKAAWYNLQQGADFDKLARSLGARNDDEEEESVIPSFSREEYDLRDDLRAAGKNLVKVAFATPTGRFSGVFQCKDCWRIIRVKDHQAASDLTYAARKEQIRDEIAKSRQWMMYVPLWARVKAVAKNVAIKLPA
jgi:parvulin-like peptidyl-prolyl isomerase